MIFNVVIDSDHLIFAIRKPFPGKVTGTQMMFGAIIERFSLTITSHMSDHGIIFNDGVEADYLQFNLGTIVYMGAAKQKVNLVVRKNHSVREVTHE